MTVRELFNDYHFHTLTPRQKLIAVFMLACAEGGKGNGHPRFLASKCFALECGGGELTPEEIEEDLQAISRALPVRFYSERGKKFYIWGQS